MNRCQEAKIERTIFIKQLKKYKFTVMALVTIISLLVMLFPSLNKPAAVHASAQSDNLISVASSQEGYLETTYENGTWWSKYGDWYGMPGAPWCAIFVSWCANQAGIAQDIIPKFAACAEGKKQFIARGRWRDKSGYTPVKGDIIFFVYAPDTVTHHVGIVEFVSGGRVYTIEGNVHDGTGENYGVRRRNYDLANSTINGYGVPNYSEVPPTSPPTAAPTPIPTNQPSPSGTFSIGYYANDNLDGSVVKTDSCNEINKNWGDGGPGAPLGNDYFSARFTGEVYFDGSYYRFHYEADDKIKIFIDSNCIFDRWNAQNISGDVIFQPPVGNHLIRVDYAEMAGQAKILLNWSPTAAPTPSPTTASTTAAPTTRTLSDAESRELINQSYIDSFFQSANEQQVQEWLANKFWLSVNDLNREHALWIEQRTITGFDENLTRQQFIDLFISILGYQPDQIAIGWNTLQLRLGYMTLADIKAKIIAGLPQETTSTTEPTATPSTAEPTTTPSTAETTSESLTDEQRKEMLKSSYRKVLYREPSQEETESWLADPWWTTESQLIKCHQSYVDSHTIPNWDPVSTKAEIIKAFVEIQGHEPNDYDLGFNLVHCQIGVLTVEKIREILKS